MMFFTVNFPEFFYSLTGEQVTGKKKIFFLELYGVIYFHPLAATALNVIG